MPCLVSTEYTVIFYIVIVFCKFPRCCAPKGQCYTNGPMWTLLLWHRPVLGQCAMLSGLFVQISVLYLVIPLLHWWGNGGILDSPWCPSVHPAVHLFVCRQDIWNFFETIIGSLHFLHGIYAYGVNLLNLFHFHVPDINFGSKLEVALKRCPIVYQDHLKWAFLDCNSSFNSQIAMKW